MPLQLLSACAREGVSVLELMRTRTRARGCGGWVGRRGLCIATGVRVPVRVHVRVRAHARARGVCVRVGIYPSALSRPQVVYPGWLFADRETMIPPV